jgi:putative flippase GtrA
MLTQSSWIIKVKKITKLVGKYASTSVIATSVDFSAFHYALNHGDATAVQSTIIGRLVGAVVAFFLHRAWVFKINNTPQSKTFIIKYILGILLGLGLNVYAVWFFNTFLGIDAWSSRVAAAASVWSLILLYNKHVVFKEKIIVDQDFTQIEEEGNENEEIVV